MNLEDLRRLLAETKEPEDGETFSSVRVDLAARESVGRATLHRQKGETWERVDVDVVLSDSETSEALQCARKCVCDNMRDVNREANSNVFVILPCKVCDAEIERTIRGKIAREDRLCGDCFHAAGFHIAYTGECCHCKQGESPCKCKRFRQQE